MALVNLEDLPPIEGAIMKHAMIWAVELATWEMRNGLRTNFYGRIGWDRQVMKCKERLIQGRPVQVFCPDCGCGVGDSSQFITRCPKCPSTGPWLNSWEAQAIVEGKPDETHIPGLPG